MSQHSRSEQNEKVKNYFIVSQEDLHTFSCTICSASLKGSVYNMKSHLIRKHTDEANELGLEKTNHSATSQTANTQEMQVSQPPEKRIRITVDANKILRKVIEQIMRRQLSLTNADDFGDLDIVGDKLKPFNITLNRRTIKDYIHQAYQQGIEIITDEFKDTYISLMYDSASRNGRNVFGVSARFIKNGEITERTLGIITMESSQTSEALLQQITTLLTLFGKSVNDVASSCSDQGRNMIKTSNLIILAQDQIHLYNNLNDSTDDFSLNGLMDFLSDDEDDENSELNETDSNEVEILRNFGSKMICMVHALQLCVTSTTKKFEKQIQTIRNVAKEAKKHENRSIFINFTKPEMDVATRWNSTFEMIDSFAKNEKHWEKVKNKKLLLDIDTWKFIRIYSSTYGPVSLTIEYLQNSKITISK